MPGPGTLTRIDNTAGLALGSAVFPYLQTSAAKALIPRAEGARHDDLETPGTSNHEGAIAVDLRGLSVKAFQKLWNRNHPTDLIARTATTAPAPPLGAPEPQEPTSPTSAPTDTPTAASGCAMSRRRRLR